jgi:uncharacterized membrane protein
MSSRLDTIFKISLLAKGLDSLLEVIGGVLLLFVTSADIARWGSSFVKREFASDPNNAVAHFITHSTAHVASGSTLFGAIYLLSHGAVKLVLVIAVLKDKLWAYPLLMFVLLIFIIYQIILMTQHVSYSLLGLTLFDSAIVLMTAIERDKHKTRHQRSHIPHTRA